LLRGVRLFDSAAAVDVQPILLQARLQAAARCTFDKGLEALYARLLAGNDLFALEQALAERSAGLFSASARPGVYERTLERYRTVADLLDAQEALLAAGGNAWMRHGLDALGPAWRDLVERAGRIELLGPAAVQQLQGRSAAAYAAFRRQFEALYGAGVEPGIVWVEEDRRFAQSPSRAALRRGLAALLKQPFMSGDAGRRAPAPGLADAVAAADALAAERALFVADHLALFPPEPRAAVARVVDARIADLLYQDAYRALKAAVASAATPFDAAQYRQRHALVAELRSHLEAVGAHALGARLQSTLEGDLLQRLAALQDQAERLPLLAAL
jgi:type VI secretion system protein ImpL